ncbi:MAG: glycine oxidase [Solirubrobacteraceae bacterium]|jgi:glycine oxidase|nr:glycine oxidase [Solirubrobacteraceae bacterium]
MANSPGSADLLVVGGGVIGLAVAWRARQRGMAVTVLERETIGCGTSRVAAGMLAPVAEAEFGQAARRVLDLGLRSADMWPAFAQELQEASGQRIGFLQTGTLLVARDADEARELERQIAFRDSLGLATNRLRPSQAREREPALAPTLRLALEAPDDHSVDPRLVLAALRKACESVGVQLREHAPVARIEVDAAGERVTGVTLGRLAGGSAASRGGRESAARPDQPESASPPDSGELLSTEHVVVASGAWSGQIEGAAERMPVRPVRGQLLRLRDPGGAGLLSSVVRFQGGYLVPRAGGRYVLGATVEERGFDVQPDAGGVYELLREAIEVVPGVRELKVEELCAGLRPGTPDNAPAIGRGALEGLTWATGHHRNGILLAPLTAQLVVQLLAGGRPADTLLAACDPRRFAAYDPPPAAAPSAVLS